MGGGPISLPSTQFLAVRRKFLSNHRPETLSLSPPSKNLLQLASNHEAQHNLPSPCAGTNTLANAAPRSSPVGHSVIRGGTISPIQRRNRPRRPGDRAGAHFQHHLQNPPDHGRYSLSSNQTWMGPGPTHRSQTSSLPPQRRRHRPSTRISKGLLFAVPGTWATDVHTLNTRSCSKRSGRQNSFGRGPPPSRRIEMRTPARTWHPWPQGPAGRALPQTSSCSGDGLRTISHLPDQFSRQLHNAKYTYGQPFGGLAPARQSQPGKFTNLPQSAPPPILEGDKAM